MGSGERNKKRPGTAITPRALPLARFGLRTKQLALHDGTTRPTGTAPVPPTGGYRRFLHTRTSPRADRSGPPGPGSATSRIGIPNKVRLVATSDGPDTMSMINERAWRAGQRQRAAGKDQSIYTYISRFTHRTPSAQFAYPPGHGSRASKQPRRPRCETPNKSPKKTRIVPVPAQCVSRLSPVSFYRHSFVDPKGFLNRLFASSPLSHLLRFPLHLRGSRRWRHEAEGRFGGR